MTGLLNFTDNLNRGGKCGADDLREMFSQYTTSSVYEWLYKNAVYTNNAFLTFLLDTAEAAAPGFFGETGAEFCWLFALSHRDYGYFKPLRDRLFALSGENEVGEIVWRKYEVDQAAERAVHAD
jgi:hypothetical protein